MANLRQMMVRVKALFPVPLDESLVGGVADAVVESAVQKALSRYEKVKTVTLTGRSAALEDATIIVRVVPAPIEGSDYNVFDFSRFRPHDSSVFYNLVDGVLLFANDGTYQVEYIADSGTLTVEDLDDTYYEWAIEYAVALLMIKEGFLGTRATLTALPLEFNYNDLRDRGLEAKERLEEELKEMFFGCFGGLSS